MDMARRPARSKGSSGATRSWRAE